MKILPGLSFSLSRALGIAQLKSAISRKVGVPLTRGGRQKKVGKLLLNLLLGRRH